jgi:hypothetical protein
LSEEEISERRYTLTWLLEDLEGDGIGVGRVAEHLDGPAELAEGRPAATGFG